MNSMDRLEKFIAESENMSFEEPYQFYEKTVPASVLQAIYVCAIPLRLETDITVELIEKFVETDSTGSNILDYLLEMPFVVRSSANTWRYRKSARKYFLYKIESNIEYARQIHEFLSRHYQKSVNGFSSQYSGSHIILFLTFLKKVCESIGKSFLEPIKTIIPNRLTL